METELTISVELEERMSNVADSVHRWLANNPIKGHEEYAKTLVDGIVQRHFYDRVHRNAEQTRRMMEVVDMPLSRILEGFNARNPSYVNGTINALNELTGSYSQNPY